jgi:hypothetical protein
MGGPWLYAIAAAAGKQFDFDGRRAPIPVTVDSYTALVRDGRLIEDRSWYIRQNWRKIEIGDELFVYTGDQNLGIVGFATINDVKQRQDGWYLNLNFDLRRCRALLKQPVPAEVVRTWVPFPRRNVISLAPFTRELYRRLPWKTTRRHAGR